MPSDAPMDSHLASLPHVWDTLLPFSSVFANLEWRAAGGSEYSFTKVARFLIFWATYRLHLRPSPAQYKTPLISNIMIHSADLVASVSFLVSLQEQIKGCVHGRAHLYGKISWPQNFFPRSSVLLKDLNVSSSSGRSYLQDSDGGGDKLWL